jgi:hypothetical protein
MEQIMLQSPTRLQLRKKDGTTIYGYNQDWYNTPWQRASGCGPTAAALLSGYVLQRDGYLSLSARDSIGKRRKGMEAVWDYVTPSHCGGLYKAEWFRRGLQQYLDEAAPAVYTVKVMPIYPFHVCPREDADVLDFIARGLRSDSPVAFLNRSRGNEGELSTWHWISIVALSAKNPRQAICYDSGRMTAFIPERWLRDATLGGGFAYIEKN